MTTSLTNQASATSVSELDIPAPVSNATLTNNSSFNNQASASDLSIELTASQTLTATNNDSDRTSSADTVVLQQKKKSDVNYHKTPFGYSRIGPSRNHFLNSSLRKTPQTTASMSSRARSSNRDDVSSSHTAVSQQQTSEDSDNQGRRNPVRNRRDLSIQEFERLSYNESQSSQQTSERVPSAPVSPRKGSPIKSFTEPIEQTEQQQQIVDTSYESAFTIAEDNNVTSQTLTSSPGQISQLCATIEVSKEGEHTRILNNLGHVEDGEARFIDMTSIQHVSITAATSLGHNFPIGHNMYLRDDTERLIPLAQFNLADLSNGNRDIVGFFKAQETVSPTNSNHRSSPGNSVAELVYEEMAVYKPVLPNVDLKFEDACKEIQRMIEDHKLKQQAAAAARSTTANNSNAVSSLTDTFNLPELLLYYKSLPGHGFLWRACRIEDFSPNMFDLGGFAFKRMYFKHQRLIFEQSKSNSGSGKGSNTRDYDPAIFESLRSHRTASRSPSLSSQTSTGK
jgi:hypothetical protein